MDVHLAQRVHPDPRVRARGIAPSDPYIEICWNRVAKPRAARLVSSVAGLTEGRGRGVSSEQLWATLGEDPAPVEVRDELLFRSFESAVHRGLGSWDAWLAYHERRVEFSVFDTVPLVQDQDLDCLHDVELAHHAATALNINQRLGLDDPYSVWLPDWVYWRAGMDSTEADLADVRDALFNRGLPDWPSLQIDEQGSARGLTPPGGPSGGPSAHLSIPGWDGPDAGQPSNPGEPAPAEHRGGLSPGQQYYSTATGDRFEYVGDDEWRIVGGPNGVPSTVPVGGIVHQEGVPDHWDKVRSEPPVAPSRDPATETAQRRLERLSRQEPTAPGLGL